MQHWIIAQATGPQINVIDAIFRGVSDNPSLVTLAVALLVFYFGTRAIKDELKASRNMLNSAQESMNKSQRESNEQENKALDMATNAINKMDRVADSIADMAQSMREASSNYFASAQLNTDAHLKTTNMLIDRIAAMDKQRAEDEIYSNGKLLVQIDEQLTQHKSDVAQLVGTILHDASLMHEATRHVVTEKNEALIAALHLSTPTDKSDSATE